MSNQKQIAIKVLELMKRETPTLHEVQGRFGAIDVLDFNGLRLNFSYYAGKTWIKVTMNGQEVYELTDNLSDDEDGVSELVNYIDSEYRRIKDALLKNVEQLKINTFLNT